MNKKLLLSTLAIFVAFMTFSQSSESKKKLKEAKSYYDMHSYELAINIYLSVIEEFESDAKSNFYLADALIKSHDKKKMSLKFFERAYKSNPKVDFEIEFLLGKSYQINHQFDDAIKYFDLYSSKQKSIDEELKKLIERHKYECENGKKYVASPVSATIENMGAQINSKFSDYVPLLSADKSTIVFTSNRYGSTGGLYDIDPSNGDTIGFFEDIYLSYKKDGEWITPTNVGSPVNTQYHDACVALSADAQEMYVYKDEGEGDLYLTTLKGDKWTSPKPLNKNINTSEYGEVHCSVSPDKNTLFFSSDRPGGYGGLDIWMSKKVNGDWGPAVNLGPTINTEYNEDSPFIHADNQTLYFSSRGHDGMGGHDVFRTFMNSKGEWIKPINLGYPINSADDDIYFLITADNRYAYYSSAGMHTEGASKNVFSGFGEKDIYILTLNDNIFASSKSDLNNANKDQTATEDETPKPVTLLKGSVTDNSNNEPLNVRISLVDNSNDETISVYESNKFSGNYVIILPSGKKYKILAQKLGYTSYMEELNIPKSETYQEIERNIVLYKLKTLTSLESEYIFKSKNYVLTSEDAKEIEDVTIRKFVLESIKKDSLARFQNLNSLDDTLKAPELKSATDSKREAFEDGALLKDSLANLQNLNSQEGKLNEPDLKNANDAKRETLYDNSLLFKKGMVLKTIYHDYDKSNTSSNSISDLQTLVEILNKNSWIKIKIESHTDSKGSSEYNMQLSKRRALDTKKYLVSKGIQDNRISTAYFGEEKPIEPNELNGEDNPNGRAKNRRSEFIIENSKQ